MYHSQTLGRFAVKKTTVSMILAVTIQHAQGTLLWATVLSLLDPLITMSANLDMLAAHRVHALTDPKVGMTSETHVHQAVNVELTVI